MNGRLCIHWNFKQSGLGFDILTYLLTTLGDQIYDEMFRSMGCSLVNWFIFYLKFNLNNVNDY